MEDLFCSAKYCLSLYRWSVFRALQWKRQSK